MQQARAQTGGRPSSFTLLAFTAMITATALARRKPRGSLARRDGSGSRTAPDASQADAAREGGRGRDAERPGEIPSRGWMDILRRTYAEFNDDRLMLVAAGVTFYALLALVPAIGALISLYGLFFDAQDVSDQVSRLSGVLPGGGIEVLSDQVTRIAEQGRGRLGLTFAVGLAVSLWSANAGVKSLFDALNIVYDEKEARSFLALTLQSLAFTFGAIVAVIVLIVAIAVIPPLLGSFGGALGLGDETRILVSVLRWPAALVLLVLGLMVLFRYGPSRKRPRWRWVFWGALVGGIGWIVFSMLFSWYVANFGSYNATYGSLGAVIGFMTWIWLSTTIILLGAELNAEMEHQTARDSTTEPERPLGQRGAEMADTVGAHATP